MTDTALLPCPFCGGTNTRIDIGLVEFVDGEVTCQDCGGNVGNHPSREEAIAGWNRRTSPSQVAPQPQAGEPVEAHGYATRLLTSLMEKHYPDRSPEWAPLPDLYGVLTQIDNLSTGLVRASPQPANPAQVTDAIRGIVDDALNSAIPEPWEVAEHATQRILAAIGAGGQAVAAHDAEDASHWKSAYDRMAGRNVTLTNAVILAVQTLDDLASGSGLSRPIEQIIRELNECASSGGAALSQPHPADERVVEALRAKVEEIRARVEKTICPTFSSDAGDIGEQGRISRQDFDTLVLAALSAKECR